MSMPTPSFESFSLIVRTCSLSTGARCSIFHIPSVTPQGIELAIFCQLQLLRAVRAMHESETMTLSVDRMEAMAHSNPLRGITVLDERGDRVLLEELWESEPVVLALVRHFG